MRYKICTGFFVKPGNKREGVGSVCEGGGGGGGGGSCLAQKKKKKKKKLKYQFIQVAWIGSNITSYIYFQFTEILLMLFNSSWYGFHSPRKVSKLLFSRAICK